MHGSRWNPAPPVVTEPPAGFSDRDRTGAGNGRNRDVEARAANNSTGSEVPPEGGSHVAQPGDRRGGDRRFLAGCPYRRGKASEDRDDASVGAGTGCRQATPRAPAARVVKNE